MATYTCTVLTPQQQEALFADVAAGITGPEAAVKYPASRSVLARLLKANGLGFARRPPVADEVVVELLAAGKSLHVIKRDTGVGYERLKVLLVEAGPFPGRVEYVNRVAFLTERMVELSGSMTNREIAAELGVSTSTVSKHLRSAGVFDSRVRNAAPKPVAVKREKKPAPVKRVKKKAPKRGVFKLEMCGNKDGRHPLIIPNLTASSIPSCLWCKKLAQPDGPYKAAHIRAHAERVEAAVAERRAEWEATHMKEVAVLTADLRPEMEKAA